MKYEFQILAEDSAVDLQRQLNELGEYGWRLVSLAAVPGDSPDDADFLYVAVERQKGGTS